MKKIVVYEKPTCTTCRKTSKYFAEKGIEVEKINYYIRPFTKNKLRTLLKKMKIEPSELLRKNEKAYKDLDIKNKNYKESEILDLLVNNHDLIQRPIVEFGEKAILARPIEKLDEIFS